MSSSFSVSRLLGYAGAVVVTVLGGAIVWDKVIAGWFSLKPTALCTVLGPVVQLAGMLGGICMTYGIVFWAISRFKSEVAVGMIVGGVLLFATPLVFPHYVGAVAECH